MFPKILIGLFFGIIVAKILEVMFFDPPLSDKVDEKYRLKSKKKKKPPKIFRLKKWKKWIKKLINFSANMVDSLNEQREKSDS